MKPQPDPCTLGICRIIEVQTKTKTSIEWKRRCQECGRETREYEFDLKKIAQAEDDRRIRVQHGETYAEAAARWAEQERVKPQSSKEPDDVDALRTGKREGISAAQNRWRTQEVTGYISKRRQRHAARKGHKPKDHQQ